MNDDWESRLPVDDHGNVIDWRYVRQGFSCLGLTGYMRSLHDIAVDNAEGH